MTLVSSTISNMINGVSQQPVALRLASQAEVQENGLSSVVEGLTKRLPVRWLSKVLDTVPADAYVHLINRDVNERYVVLITGGDLRVFDLNGNEKVVNFPDGKGYLSSTPREGFRSVTVADYTFIANKTRTVAMEAAKSPQLTREAMVWIKQGNYGTKYKVFLNGSQVASVTTPDGGTSSHINDIQTDKIAEDLRAAIAGNSAYTCNRQGSTLRIRRSDGADFSVRTEDSFGDQAMVPIKGTIQRFSELPSRAFDGFTVEVAGDNTSNFDNYWMQYDDDGAVTGKGVWRETVAPDIPVSLDASTMPHVLIRQADGTFTFKVADWASRVVGDEDSNPEPSFVGRRINDVFFHRNRLGFIADESAVLSRASEFFSFWRETATALLDNDPVDVAASHVKVSILRHAVPFNEELLLFSDQTQFILSSDNLLTPQTAVIRQTTEFESDLNARPVGAGHFVYFAFVKGRYAGLREYFAKADQTGNDAEDATANVPQYIPSGVFRIAASSNEQTIAVVSRNDPGALYVYRYYYSGSEVVQSAWSRWDLGPDTEVLDCDFIDSDLVIVMGRSDGVHLGSLPVESGYIDEGSTYATRLDMRITQDQLVSRTYNPETDRTRIVLPYVNREGTDRTLRVVTKEGVEGQSGGRILDAEVVDDTGIDLLGDQSSVEFWVGEEYPFRYQFSYPMIREESVGGGQAAVTTGRLQIRTFSVTFTNTGFFEARVSIDGGSPSVYPFTGLILGDAIIGSTNLEEGTHRFPVFGKNDRVGIELVNDTFLPCTFLGAEWEGFSVIRSRRL